MNLFAALIYWVIVAVWLTTLGTISYFYVRNPRAYGTTRLLLAVLAVDATRNILENIYFGLYFGSQYGILPPELAHTLGQPFLLVLPKILNVISGCIVIGGLLLRWLRLAVRERGRTEQHSQDLEALATIDWLTGLYNRRHFETLAHAELARCQRYIRPLSVLMIDIDHFKAVNDEFGHAAGDQVLKAVAQVIIATKRDSDIVARIGGEEFAVMLPETTDAAATLFGERVRKQVQDWSLKVDGAKLTTTVSIGIAGATLRTSGIETLEQAADQALYEAKRTGRNRVVVSRSPIPLHTAEVAE